MKNSELVKILAKRSDLTQKETKRLLRQSIRVLSDRLGDYIGFSIPDLGTFTTHIREERQAYDLNRRSHVILPPKRLVSFSPAVTLKDDIKDVDAPAPKSKPEPVAAPESPPAAEEAPEIEEDETESVHDVLMRENLADAEAAKEAAEAAAAEAAADEPDDQLMAADDDSLDAPEMTEPEIEDLPEPGEADSLDDLPPLDSDDDDPTPEEQP